jgi:hypothetical protein
MKTISALFLIFGVCLPVIAKERIDSRGILSVNKGNQTYSFEFKHHAQVFQGYISATRKGGSGKIEKLWDTMIYSGVYSSAMSQSHQQVRLKSLEYKDNALVAVDDEDKIYRIDVKTGAIVSPEKPVVYGTLENYSGMSEGKK